MKVLLIVSSLLFTSTFGEVISNSYSTFVHTPHAITKTAQNDAGFSYSVSSGQTQPVNLLYSLQHLGTPLALTYSSLRAAPFNYIAQNVLPYDIYKQVLPKVIIPYSTFAVSPLVSHLSSIYQTSSIPTKIDEEKKSDDAKKIMSMDSTVMAGPSPIIPQNPFLATFFDQSRFIQQVPSQNSMPVSSVAADMPIAQESNVKDHDTVGVESA